MPWSVPAPAGVPVVPVGVPLLGWASVAGPVPVVPVASPPAAPGWVEPGWVGVAPCVLLCVEGVVMGVEGVLPPLPCPNGKNEPPDIRVAIIPAITATRATPISKSGQLRLSQSMNPILRLAPRNWSNLGSRAAVRTAGEPRGRG